MTMKKALSLTHIEYDDKDILGKLLAISSLIPLHILTAYCVVICLNRCTTSIVILIGQLLNECLNAVLKRLLKEARPGRLGNGYGMPSSHTQFMAFFAFYSYLHIGKYFKRNKESRYILVLLAALVAYSRLYLGYHTVWQVAAGLMVGVFFAYTWWAARKYTYRFVAKVLSIGKVDALLLSRDSRDIDILKVSWDAVHKKAA